MGDMHLNAKLFMQMFGQMLCRINATVLTSRATKAEHQVGETTLDVATHMVIGQGIYTIKKVENFAIIFQKAYNRLVKTS